MAVKLVYAIIDLESKWFVTRGTYPKLEELGINTRLFESKSEAMRFIEYKPAFEFSDLAKHTVLQDSLAWWLLEKIYHTDRWHINCSKQEFEDAIDNVSKLKAVPINLEYDNNVVKS